jgi:competence protein ComEA
LNDATPQWRAFSSDAPATDAAEPGPQSSGRALPRWLVPALAGLGGLAAGAALIGVVVAALGLPAAADGGYSPDLPTDTFGAVAATAPAPPTEIVVDVAGAVVRPGLHRLRSGDRVGDAIEAAGGYAPRADLAASSQALNLAQTLEDGAKVLVPELGIDRATSAAAEDGRIDINHAGRSELESLPGIGPVTAGKIIAARGDEAFAGVRDLRSRGLVGESVYEDIKGLVRAG